MCVSERKSGILCMVTNGNHSSGEDCGKYHIIYWWFGCCVTSTMGGPLWTATLGKRQVSVRGREKLVSTAYCRCCTQADAHNNNSNNKEVRREASQPAPYLSPPLTDH